MTTELITHLFLCISWIFSITVLRKLFKSKPLPYDKPKVIDLYILIILFWLARLIYLLYTYFDYAIQRMVQT